MTRDLLVIKLDTVIQTLSELQKGAPLGNRNAAKDYQGKPEVVFGKELTETLRQANNELGGKTNFNLKTIRLRQVDAPNVPTEPDQLKKIESLKEAIRNGKILPPIVVTEREGDMFLPFEVVDGNHRYQAYRQLGITSVPMLVTTDYGEGDGTIKDFENHSELYDWLS